MIIGLPSTFGARTAPQKGGRFPPHSLLEKLTFPFVAPFQAVAGITREQYRRAKQIAAETGVPAGEAYKRAKLSPKEMIGAARGAWRERLGIGEAMRQMEVPEMGGVTLPTMRVPKVQVGGRTLGGGELPGSGARLTGRGALGTAMEFAIPTVPLGSTLRAGAKVTGLAPKIEGVSQMLLKKLAPLRAPSAKVSGEVTEKFAERGAAIRMGTEAAEEAGRIATKGLSGAERTRLGQVLKGGITTRPELAERAAKMRALREPITKGLVEELGEVGARGMGRKVGDPLRLAQQITSTMETYMPTLYHKFEDVAKGIGVGQLPRLKVDRLLKKTDWTDEIKKLRLAGEQAAANELEDFIKSLGEITKPAYPFAKGMAQVTELTENSKLIRWLDSNFASLTKISEDMTQLPKLNSLGSLSGKFIDKGIAEMLTARGVIRQPSSVFRKILGMWKGGKVLLNPATQSRNHISDSFLMHLSGMPLYQQPAYLLRAAREYLDKGKLFKEFRRSGALRVPWFRSEISSLLEGVGTGGNPVARWTNALIRTGGKAYEAGEELRKMALYMFQRDQGKSMEEAASFTRKWLIDYTDIPEAIQWLKNAPLGAPFITFYYKAIPLIGEAALEKTGQMAGIMKGINVLNTPPSQEEWEALPDHLKQGMKIRLPFTDSKDRPLYFDIDYIVPWGIFGEAVQRGPAAILPTNPAFTILSDLYKNKNVFGSPIWKETDTGDEKLRKTADYLYKQLMPSLAPAVPLTKGGYSWEKLVSALKGKPDYWGDMRDIPTTLLDVFLGLKMRPVEVERERMFRKYEQRDTIEELQKKIRSITRDERIPPEEKKTKIDDLTERIIELRQKMIK